MNTQITQRYRLRAIHQLPECNPPPQKNTSPKDRTQKPQNPISKKNSIHGHDYKIEVTCYGKIDPNSGLLLHRDWMNEIINTTIIDNYDKTLLNKYLPIPSGELLCYFIFRKLYETELRPLLYKVEICETPKLTFSYQWVEGASG